jgi:7-cyano-7-deazaguanosine (preQ0) biosynthesis protein QueE
VTATVTATLVVSEVFGPTLQGEGPSMGQRAGFVRLGRCSLNCKWCDTAYTWDWQRFDPATELRELSVDDVAARVRAMHVPMVVITGGEPLLQQRAIVELLHQLPGLRVEVETNGIHDPADALVDHVDQFNVSPKLSNSGIDLARRYKPDVLRAFAATGKAVFKFVACEPPDLDEIDVVVAECALANVWVMPEGTDAVTIVSRLQRLSEPVLARGWNLTPRLHILLWGNTRGV